MASENQIRVQLPTLPAPSFFSNPDFTMLTADGQCLLSYDPQTLAGFVYEIASGRWHISAPIDFLHFASSCACAGHTIPPGAAADRWLQACRGTQANQLN